MIQSIAVNYLALLGCGIASIIIGSLWYGPLFGKQWMKLSGITPPKKIDAAMKKKMMSSYVIAFIGSLILAYVLAHALSYAGAVTIPDALVVAFWNWLGFIATVQLGMVLWDSKPLKLFVLTTSYNLVSLLIMAVILVSFA